MCGEMKTKLKLFFSLFLLFVKTSNTNDNSYDWNKDYLEIYSERKIPDNLTNKNFQDDFYIIRSNFKKKDSKVGKKRHEERIEEEEIEGKVKKLTLNKYASDVIIRKHLMDRFESLEELFVICSQEKEIVWIKEDKELQIKNIKKLILLNYSSIILMKLSENIEIKEIDVSCYLEDQVKWIVETKELQLKEIERLILSCYATKILMKLKETIQIDTLVVWCSKEDQIKWIKDYKELKIEKIRKIDLERYALKLLMKLKKDIEIEELRVSCYKEDELSWLNEIEELEIKKTEVLELHHDASKILMKLKEDIEIDILNVFCYREDEIEWIISESKEIQIDKINELNLGGYDCYSFGILKLLKPKFIQKITRESFNTVVSKKLEDLMERDAFRILNQEKKEEIKKVIKIMKKDNNFPLKEGSMESFLLNDNVFPSSSSVIIRKNTTNKS